MTVQKLRSVFTLARMSYSDGELRRRVAAENAEAGKKVSQTEFEIQVTEYWVRKVEALKEEIRSARCP